MGLFSRKKKHELDPMIADANHKLIEVVAHKSANKEVVSEAKNASQQLNNLLNKNGFTIKIFLAASEGGGHN